MSDNLQELKLKIDKLELLISFLLMNEIVKGDPKFNQMLKILLKENSALNLDDILNKYKSSIKDNSSKMSQIDLLIERINLVDKLFNDLKNSTDGLSSENKQ